MRNTIRQIARPLLTPWVARVLGIANEPVWFHTSYAQEGEDMILRRIFETQTTGFYVDVGAHHPQRFSNTYFFYQRGWCGINIDATPGGMALFEQERPDDTNIEAAIANGTHELSFFIFNEPALNTFDAELARQREGATYTVLRTEKIATRTLADVLACALPIDQTIDFLSIDVEGFDFDVLRSNDWQRFRPRYVLVECYEPDLESVLHTDLHHFLIGYNYRLFAKTFRTVFYQAVAESR